jgi:hypothetical protein
MKPTYNHVELMGEISFIDRPQISSNGSRCTVDFDVEVRSSSRLASGETQNHIDVFQVILTNQTADWVDEHLCKGTHVFVIGTLKANRSGIVVLAKTIKPLSGMPIRRWGHQSRWNPHLAQTLTPGHGGSQGKL